MTLTVSAAAEDHQNEFVHLLAVSKIDHFHVDGVSFSEAIDEIAEHWAQLHPDVPFQFGIADFEPDEELAQVSVELEVQDATFLEVLNWLGELTRQKLSVGNGMVGFQSIGSSTGGWHTLQFEPSEKMLEFFQSHGQKITSKGIAKILRSLLGHPISVRYDRPSNTLSVTSTEREINKLEGIMALLDEGYSISLPKMLSQEPR